MRSANKTIYVESSYSQKKIHCQLNSRESQQQSFLSQSRLTAERQMQKTEQPIKMYVSANALKSVNQQLYQIVNMDPRTAESHLRKSAKCVYDLIDNELLLNIKHLSNMKLLMYDTILMYVEEYSQHEKNKLEWRQKEKSLSNSAMKNVGQGRQQDVALQTFSPVQSNNRQFQNLKETIPFVPKDKSKIPKSARKEFIQEELTAKIESIKQSLENILKKIQHYGNYRLSGEDIIRLKRSVVNVSELQPSFFLSLQCKSPTKTQKSNIPMENSRPQSRESRKRPQSSSKARNDQKSKTYNGNFNLPETTNSFSMQIPSKTSQFSDNDQEGNKLLIEQLQQIIERKQNRIKQLTKELTKSLSDQGQLQKTMESFQVQIHEIQSERKSFRLVIEKLQEENLNYQLEIKQLKEAQILRKEVDKLTTESHHEDDLSQYHMLREFEIRQKACKFVVRKEIDVIVQNSPITTINNIQSSTQKNPISLSGAIALNDISEITPKRLSKKLLLPPEIQESYIYESNVITTRRGVTASEVRSKDKDPSLSKYQMITGSRTQMKSKKQHDCSDLAEIKNNQSQNYQKILFLQALTIQQMLQDI